MGIFAIIIYIIAVIINMWSIKLCAKWLGARRVSWLWSFLTILATAVVWFVAQFIVAFIAIALQSMAIPFVILMAILIPSFVYCLVLDVSYLRAIAILLLSTIINLVIMFLIGLVLFVISLVTGVGASSFNSLNLVNAIKGAPSEAQEALIIKEFRVATTRLCNCGKDMKCLEKHMKTYRHLMRKAEKGHYDDDQKLLIVQQVNRGVNCMRNPSKDNYSPVREEDLKALGAFKEKKRSRNKKESYKEEASANTSKHDTLTSNKEEPSVYEAPKPEYVMVKKANIKQYIGWQARMTLRNGRKKHGVIGRIHEGMVAVKMSRHGGHITSYVSVDDIRKLEVLKIPERK